MAKILVVEESQVVANVTSELLMCHHHEVQVVARLEDMGHALSYQTFDAALIDTTLADRCLPIAVEMRPEMPIMVTSASRLTANDIQRLSSLGAKAFLNKPYSTDTLCNAVRNLIDSHGAGAP